MQRNNRVGPERNRGRLALALAVSVALAGLAAAGPALADYNSALTAYQRQDYASALRDLEQPANQGDARAQRLLGLMYRDGQGVSPDPVRAYMWLDLAAANGQDAAAGERDSLAQRMTADQKAQAQRQVQAWRLGPDTSAPSDENNNADRSAEAPPPAPPAPFPQETAPPVPEDQGAAQLGQQANEPSPNQAAQMGRSQIADLQWQLAVHGYDPGPADGIDGPQTERAIRQYQADAGLSVDGEPSQDLLDHLQYAPPTVSKNARNAGGSGPSTFSQSELPPPTALVPPSPPMEGPPQPPYPDASPPPSTAGIPVAPELLPVYTATVQEELARRGYYQGPADGRLGPQTRDAIRHYQQDRGMPVTGEVTLDLVNYLRIIGGGAS